MKWLLLCLGVSCLGLGAVVACSSTGANTLDLSEDAGRRRDTGPQREPEETDPMEEEDAGDPSAFDPQQPMDFDAAVEPVEAGPDNGSCVGQADGFRPDGGAAQVRCCKAVPTDLSQNGNCGACGITCPNNGTCVPVPGKEGAFRCSGCTTDGQCRGGGFGAAATCFDVRSAPAFCNCQCPGASPTTCLGQCAGGATCYEVPGTNYCAYP